MQKRFLSLLFAATVIFASIFPMFLVKEQEPNLTQFKLQYFTDEVDYHNDGRISGNYDERGNFAYTLGFDNYIKYLSTFEDKKEVIVAVIDSGVNYQHSIFNGRLLLNQTANNVRFITSGGQVTHTRVGQNFVGGEGTKDMNDITDENGHGTHVAGTIADLTLPNVKILPLKIFGEGEDVFGFALENAIYFLTALKKQTGMNIVAVNMSLGTEPLFGTEFVKTKNDYQPLINSLLSNNILPIVASGNGYTTGPNKGVGSSLPSIPAACDGVIAVGSIERNEKRSNFSNYGSHLSLSAPGKFIWSAWLPYDNTDAPYSKDDHTAAPTGTSMAAPFVTAAYANLMSLPDNSSVTLDDSKTQLCQSSVDIGAPGFDEQYGYGYVKLSTGDDDFSDIELPPINDDPAVNLPNIGQQYIDEEIEEAADEIPLFFVISGIILLMVVVFAIQSYFTKEKEETLDGN
ncbi:MAG: S8 family serine peptidase [Christensenellaceae bacterium]|nr:S8 family serine peptidase [Christensenellaceae bacterium]